MTFRKVLLVSLAALVGAVALLVVVGIVAFYAIFHFPNRSTAVARTIVSAGRRRGFLLYVPGSYNGARRVPLVISLHPAMSWPSAELSISGWNRLADERGFLVVYPAGEGWGPRVWGMDGWRDPPRMADVRFISALLDTLETEYRVDPARIYADGMSNGGGMAFALSCTLSRRIAAVGAVSAAQSLPSSWCADSVPVPMIAFHGTADPFVPYAGAAAGWLNPAPFPNERRWVTDWARRNRCAPRATDSLVAEGVTRTTYGGCARGASVVLYTIHGGGHQWPGGRPLPRWLVGPYTRAVDATRLEWEFFMAHPRVGGMLAAAVR